MPRTPRVYSPRRGSSIPANARPASIDKLYRDANGSLPDFTRLDRRPPSWRRWVIIGSLSTLAVLAIAAWAGFFIFKPYRTTTTDTLGITIDAPARAAVGTEVTYRIRIANGDRVPVARTSVDVKLPPDFAMAAADPPPTDATTPSWTLGTIAADTDRVITVRGRVYGTPEQSARVEATALYRPANFNADFQATTSAETVLEPSALTLALEGPERIAPGTPATYTLTYEYRGTSALPPAAITGSVPETFMLASTTPDRPRMDVLEWPLGELAPNAKGTLTLVGSFRDTTGGPATVRVAAFLVLAPDRRVLQTESTMTTAILGGDVALTATVNDQIGRIDAHPGDTLRFRIAVRNAGTAELRGLTIRAVFEATAVQHKSILDFNRITDPTNGTAIGEQLAADRRRGTVTWTAATTPALVAVPPGEQRTIDVTIPVHSAASLPGFTGTGSATFTGSVTIDATGTTTESRMMTTAPIMISVK